MSTDAPANEAVFVRAARLTKWYGKVTALSDLSIHLDAGIWGLLGPNGSGKTTFLRLVGGQLKPSLGKVTVAGLEPFANPEALRRIGICPEADALYDELTGLEFVTTLAEMSGYGREAARERARAALVEFGLEDAMHRRIAGYSRGMRQRVKLAQAIVHEPEVLLLDEPLTGTDPTSRAVILEAVRRRAAAGALVIFSTHVLHEVEALTDRVLLIARGQLVAQGRTREIRELLEEHPHHIRVECERPRELAARLVGLAGVAGVRLHGDSVLEVETREPDATYQGIARAALEGDHHVRSLTSPDASLEALFHYLVEHGSRGAGTGVDREVGAPRPLAAASTHIASPTSGEG